MKSKRTPTLTATLFTVLVWIGALFYFVEAPLHFFGLPILEHDEIFLPTHDRYIAIMAITYGVLLILILTNIRKYQALFVITMVGILAQGVNAGYITASGGYGISFHTQDLDREIVLIGYGFLLWYPLTWLSWLKARKMG
jgi:hypothetical protein